MCSFCKKIYTELECEEELFLPENFIIKKNDEYYYFWHECPDSWYSGSLIKINYCPICGRKL